MASPHNAGAAALVRQAHPTWDVDDIKSAIVNTAIRRSGRHAPLQDQPRPAPGRSSRQGDEDPGHRERQRRSKFEVAVNFGFEELKHDFSKTKTITLENHGASDATFEVSQTNVQGSPHSIGLSDTSVTVPAGGKADVQFTLDVPAATAGAANGAGLSFQEVAGLITFTPSAGQNSDVALRVPYYLVPRALSEVDATLASGTLAQGQTSGPPRSRTRPA